MCVFLHNLRYLGCNSLNNQHWNWCLFYLRIYESLVTGKMFFVLSLVPVLKQQFNENENLPISSSSYENMMTISH